MLDRRLFLSATAAAGAMALARPAAAASAGERFHALMDDFARRDLERQPTTATIMGLDTGARSYLKSRMPDGSLAQTARDAVDIRRRLKALAAIDRAKLQGSDPIFHEILSYGLGIRAEAGKFGYGAGSPSNPYVISQLNGAYGSAPDYLDYAHNLIETAADAEACLARLEAFAVNLDDDSAQVRHDAARGVMAPDFALDKALAQMIPMRDTPAGQAGLVQSLVRRTREKGIAGDWEARATRLYRDKVAPALARQVALVESLRPKAVHDAGVWRLPHGDDYYRLALKSQTTTTMTPQEIHQIGLERVAGYTAEIDAIMRARGMTQGTVGQRLRGMYSDPRFLAPNTAEAKAKLIGDLNHKMQEIQTLLPRYFGVLPKAAVEIRQAPEGNGGGYYNGSLDGSRPGIYYVDLHDTAHVPSWTLPTVTAHEASPGHHLQQALAGQADVPLALKLADFNAYNEGWALYAEQLVDEMGLYENDPFGRIGMLRDAMLRASRLVVDTGMHAMRWSRETAMRYNVDTLGDSEEAAAGAIERYAVWPGQACGYMIGKLKILQLRQRARDALGERFDIKGFHDVVLLSGSMPLAVLEKVVDRWIAQTRG